MELRGCPKVVQKLPNSCPGSRGSGQSWPSCCRIRRPDSVEFWPSLTNIGRCAPILADDWPSLAPDLAEFWPHVADVGKQSAEVGLIRINIGQSLPHEFGPNSGQTWPTWDMFGKHTWPTLGFRCNCPTIVAQYLDTSGARRVRWGYYSWMCGAHCFRNFRVTPVSLPQPASTRPPTSQTEAEPTGDPSHARHPERA